MAANRDWKLSLLTGFPGFIGSRLVSGLLDRDPSLRIVVLVEARMRDKAHEAANMIDSKRIKVLVGDIAEPLLGLSDEDYGRLVREVRSVFHLAAIYDLAIPEEIAAKVNVDGTANVVELCRAAEKLERHNYVSTCYVAGDRTGLVREHELEEGQGFKNHYEATKYAAEVIVRNSMDEVPTTIYRPGIVVGDSQTGVTQKFDGPYFILRVISRCVKTHVPIPSFGHSDAPFNAVPVDFIVNAILAVSADPEGAGETLHLCDPSPLTARQLTEVLAIEYGGRRPRVKVPMPVARAALRLGPVKAALGGTPPQSLMYLDHSVLFDAAHTSEILARHRLRCPRFAEYAGPIVRFFKEHEDDESFIPGYKLPQSN